MELQFRASFYRDWDKTGGKKLSGAIREISLRIKQAHAVSQIPRMKQLRYYKRGYKIELHVHTKIYWILCDVTGNTVILTRIKSEAWCKKNL